MDLASLATDAVALLSPWLGEIRAGAMKKVGEQAAASVLARLRATLGPSGQEALDDLAVQPDVADVQATLRRSIVKALEADPAFAVELSALLPAKTARGDTMTQNVSGIGNKAIENKGSGNTNTIS